MNKSMQPAIQHLFQVSSLEDVTLERLEALVEEYPCYGFGHYLLSRKLAEAETGQLLAVTQKTSLYFSNPFWLQWMLDNASAPARAPVPIPAPATDAVFQPQPELEPEPEPAPEPIPPFYPSEVPIRDEEPPFVLEERATPAEVEQATREPQESQEPREPQEPLAESPADTSIASPAAALLLESLEKARELRESLLKINEDFGGHNGRPPAAEEEQPAEPQPLAHPQAETPEPAPRSEPAPVTDTALLFEPLHTIDYFASQGIRLTLDENPTDPLGRQLKSFTDWLRTMRRLPQKDREIIQDRVAEQAVQNFAAHSIEGKEVVTEAMAEVLAKQGMPERARLVYEKLSLLNPDKSAYFAAKIEQLNIH